MRWKQSLTIANTLDYFLHLGYGFPTLKSDTFSLHLILNRFGSCFNTNLEKETAKCQDFVFPFSIIKIDFLEKATWVYCRSLQKPKL